jgi:hypothetical protein
MEVQITGGHFYATSDEDIAVIIAAHDLLRDGNSNHRWRPFVRAIDVVHNIHDRRQEKSLRIRSKQRQSYWHMLEQQVVEMSLADMRLQHIRERQLQRRHARTQKNESHREALRGMRHRIRIQEARQRQEEVEAKDMAKEEMHMRQVARVWAQQNQLQLKQQQRISVLIFKQHMQSRLKEATQVKAEREAMSVEEASQRMKRMLQQSQSHNENRVTCEWPDQWTVTIVTRVDLTKACRLSHLAFVELLYEAKRIGTVSSFVYEISNGMQLKRGLFRQRYELPISVSSVTVYREVKLG